MNDTDFKTNLENIEKQLVSINRKTPGSWGALARGILTGFGSVLGVVIAITIIGFVLNILGIIPAFRNEVDSWKSTLNQAQNYRTQVMPNK